MASVPVTAAGVSSRMLSSRRLGITFTHSLAPASIASISASGTSRRSLIVSAWLWQRMAPMRTHSESTGIDRALSRPRILLVSAPPFHSSRLMPLPRSLSIHGYERARQRHPEVLGREAVVAQDAGDLAVDVEDGRVGIVEQSLRREVRLAHLLQQLAHVLRAGAGRRLVGHARHPLDQVALEQPGQRHHHQADRAVAADVVADALAKRRVDDRPVDRVEDDHRVVLHAQRLGRVDPVTVPAAVAKLRIHRRRPVAALARDDRVQSGERPDVVRVQHRLRVSPADRRVPLPPAFDVEKNTGSIDSKSRSSRIRCMRTDPTIPRQPTNPTRMMISRSDDFEGKVFRSVLRHAGRFRLAAGTLPFAAILFVAMCLAGASRAIV